MENESSSSESSFHIYHSKSTALLDVFMHSSSAGKHRRSINNNNNNMWTYIAHVSTN